MIFFADIAAHIFLGAFATYLLTYLSKNHLTLSPAMRWLVPCGGAVVMILIAGIIGELEHGLEDRDSYGWWGLLAGILSVGLTLLYLKKNK